MAGAGNNSRVSGGWRLDRVEWEKSRASCFEMRAICTYGYISDAGMMITTWKYSSVELGFY